MALLVLGLLTVTILALGGRGLSTAGRSEHPHLPRRGGAAVVRPPRGRNAMLAGLALGPVALLVALLVRMRWQPAEDQAGLALAVALLGLGGWVVAWLLAAEFRQRLLVDTQSLERVFAVTRLKVGWSEIEVFRWNPCSRWFFVVAAGAWLWVPADFDGIADFAALALTCLPPAVLRADPEVRPTLETLARGGAPE